MSVRLVSYNVMAGGEGRADPIAEVLLGQRADVIGIHEADDPIVLRRLSDRLKMEFVVADCAGGRVALFTRARIAEAINVAIVHRSSMPILDALIQFPGGAELYVRVAHLVDASEADRMAQRLRTLVPMVMLMSHNPPIGTRVIDGQLVKADRAMPARSHAPVRQIDQVLVRPDVPVKETWIEQDRLAYYASDHLPAGAEIEVG